MAPSRQEIIEGLRHDIRRIERRAPRDRLCASSGCADVDALLPGGGFPRGSLSELAGGRASGKTAVALSAIAALPCEALAAFVDGRGELYPPAARARGVDLDRLLIVRPPQEEPAGGAKVRRALWAAEALLASGAFALVAVDVDVEARFARVAQPMLQRLRTAAERGDAVGLWLSSLDAVRAPAAVRLEVEARPGGYIVRRAFARGLLGGGATPCARVHHAA